MTVDLKTHRHTLGTLETHRPEGLRVSDQRLATGEGVKPVAGELRVDAEGDITGFRVHYLRDGQDPPSVSTVGGGPMGKGGVPREFEMIPPGAVSVVQVTYPKPPAGSELGSALQGTSRVDALGQTRDGKTHFGLSTPRGNLALAFEGSAFLGGDVKLKYSLPGGIQTLSEATPADVQALKTWLDGASIALPRDLPSFVSRLHKQLGASEA